MNARGTSLITMTAHLVAATLWWYYATPTKQGEASYRGRSTSEWQRELDGWDVRPSTCATCSKGALIWYEQAPTTLDCLAQKTGIPVRSTIRRLPLLDGDPQSLPVLAQLLQSGEEKAQLVAIEGLRRMGDDARPAVPALVEALDDENDKVSGDAAIVLYSLDLQALLRHPSFRVSARQADTP